MLFINLTLHEMSFVQVRWDDMEPTWHNRISPWEIEPSGSFSASNDLVATGLKRTRIGLPSAQLEFPIPSKSFEVLLIVVCPTPYINIYHSLLPPDRWDWNVRLWGIIKVPEGLARSRNFGCYYSL